MPIYEFACRACGHQFERMQKVSDPLPELCPTCGAAEVRKLVSATAFVLKGGGWYKDHYGLKPGGESKAPAAGEGGTAPAAAAPASTAAAAPAAPAAAAPSTGGSSGGSASGGNTSAAAK